MRSARTVPLILSCLHRMARAMPWSLSLAAASAVETGEGPHQPIGSEEFWMKMVISIGLVLLGGVFAGLTLGLMGLDELHLRVLASSSDDPRERLNASKGQFAYYHGWYLR